MSTPGVPPWGCPWHGLIKNGRLQLPNGEEMEFPEPAWQSAWQRGMALKLARPGMPEVETSAADAEHGRAWRNWAILAGARSLHAKRLPGDGWIYIDPAGNSWLVSTTLNQSISSGFSTCSVKLQRFGVPGGQPLEYTIEVPMPDIQQSAPVIEGVSGLSVALFDARPDGSAAIIMLSTQWLDSFGLPLRDDYCGDAPLGWLEIKLSGAGDEVECEIQVLKSRAQTLGVATDNRIEETYRNYQFSSRTESEDIDENTRITTTTYELTPNPQPGAEGVALIEAFGSASRSLSGYVLAMWYGDEDIAELQLTVSETVTAAGDDALAITPGLRVQKYVNGQLTEDDYTEFRASWSGIAESSVSISLSLNGEVVSSRSVKYEADTTQAMFLPKDQQLMKSGTISAVGDGVSETSYGEVPATFPEVFGQEVVYQAQLPGSWRNWLSSIVIARLGIHARSYYCVLRASQAVFGLMRYPQTTGEADIFQPLVTPQGGVTPQLPAARVGGFGLPPLYASLEPVSKQLALDSTPICFT